MEKMKGGEEMVDKKTVDNRSRYFGVILYPEEDNRHKDMLRYLENHMFQFEHCYINHDSEDEEKKNHTHVLIKVRQAQRVTAFVKFFDLWINYAEAISDPIKYIMYMLHDTPESINKKRYTVDSLKGSRALVRIAYDIRNLHFIQLGEFAKRIDDGSTLSSLVREICAEPDEDLQNLNVETVNKYQYLMVAMGQEKRSLQSLSYRAQEAEIKERTLQLHLTGEI